jgi:hypothetical protein
VTSSSRTSWVAECESDAHAFLLHLHAALKHRGNRSPGGGRWYSSSVATHRFAAHLTRLVLLFEREFNGARPVERCLQPSVVSTRPKGNRCMTDPSDWNTEQSRLATASASLSRGVHRLFGLLCLCTFAGAPTAIAQESWMMFTDGRGTSVQYPQHLLPLTEDTERGRKFVSGDGRSTLHVYSGPNQFRESPARLLRRSFTRQSPRLTYQRIARNFFVISAPQKDQILYRRCNLTRERVHCIDLTYPREDKQGWDYAVTRISRTLRPL